MFPSGWQSAHCQLVGVSLNTYGEFPFSLPGWVGILPGEDSPWEVWNGRALLFWVSAGWEEGRGGVDLILLLAASYMQES